MTGYEAQQFKNLMAEAIQEKLGLIHMQAENAIADMLWNDIDWFKNQINTLNNLTTAIVILLLIAIGIGAAVLINQRKIKKQLRELLDQKEDKP